MLVLFSFNQHSTTATVAMLATVVASMVAVIFSLLRLVFRRRRARGIDLVLASITAYLIMGGLFAATSALIEIGWPGTFLDPQATGPALTWQELMYFSYVTISTLGYGDVLPTTAWGRSLSSMLAVGGTLYLTVVVARLVGIWSSNQPTESTTEGPTGTTTER